EGKVIYQYNNDYSLPRYFINEERAKAALIDKEVRRIKKETKCTFSAEQFEQNEFKLEYQAHKLVYRDVARSTDERSLIATLLPEHVFTGNTLNHFVNFSYKDQAGQVEQIEVKTSELLFLQALLNSLILNYYLRNKISAHASFYYVYELPIPEAAPEIKQQIIEKSFTLLYCKSQSELYEDLRLELNIAEIDPKQQDLVQIRAELEILIAQHLYQLDADDWQHLTSTFIYGNDSVTKQELDKIIDNSQANW
ncbi:MAG: hypothetical protein VSS52_013215, partial [Thiotrichaceae bacterium]|nr:hypothetical protein [Thiotrichaceae bacterium]